MEPTLGREGCHREVVINFNTVNQNFTQTADQTSTLLAVYDDLFLRIQ